MPRRSRVLAARDVGTGIRNELPARRRASQIDRRRRLVLDQFGLLDHHHRIGAARDDAAGGDRGRGAGLHFERWRNAASDHFGVERQALRRAVASAGGVGRTHGKAVDIGAIEWRRVDRRDHVDRKHAGERSGKRHGFGRQRRTISAGLETPTRFSGGHYFKKLLLPRGAAHRIENRRADPAPVGSYDHSVTATCAPAAKPSLSAGTTTQPSLRASAINDK